MNSIEDTKHTDKFLSSWSDTSDLKTVSFFNKCESIYCVCAPDGDCAIFSDLFRCLRVVVLIFAYFYFRLLIWLCVLNLVIVLIAIVLPFALMALPLSQVYFSFRLSTIHRKPCAQSFYALQRSFVYRTRH